ncbi:Malonyl CoA-acyl carrier protein transacylase [invertebrate metagenome]|uniref:[acyl-carrier-protein] S-malonyltransferase n=1 Tax=invertebrate metagenome TaxID=1711999 RepID=A0A484H604_9ZZZZ
MAARAFVFPGQGSQCVGMGLELAETFSAARLVFEEVDEVLKQHLSHLMFEGPEMTLMLTENAQPALMAVSMAVLRVLEDEGGLDLQQHAQFVAGHSLGEYSALTAAKSFTLSDAVQLVKIRGKAMQKAVPAGLGAMAALLGLDLDRAREVAAQAAEGEVCTAANDNAPTQVVVSGHMAAVQRAVALAAAYGAKRSAILPVSAPFHCELMRPAAETIAEALAHITLEHPAVPLVANVTANCVEEPVTIRSLLVEQMTQTVRWRESVMYMHEQGVTQIVEVGVGKVLTGLTRRIARDLTGIAVHTPREIEAFLNSKNCCTVYTG